MDREPWAHVAFKGSMFGGVISHDSGMTGQKEQKSWKRQVAKFCGGFIADGYEIKTVYSREEYVALLETLKT